MSIDIENTEHGFDFPGKSIRKKSTNKPIYKSFAKLDFPHLYHKLQSTHDQEGIDLIKSKEKWRRDDGG